MIIYIKVPDSDIQSDEYLTLHLVPVSSRVIDHSLDSCTAVNSIVYSVKLKMMLKRTGISSE